MAKKYYDYFWTRVYMHARDKNGIFNGWREFDD